MADTYTTNLNLTKPEPGAAEDTWGISLNADLDSLDAIFSSSGTQINLNPNQINFADGKKAVFGNSSDLEIYHDGSNSWIKDAGTGDLVVRSSTNIFLQDATGANNYAKFTTNAVELRHNNNVRFTTTSTGIDVTGTVTADGLTVAGTSYIQSTTQPQLEIAYNSGNITGFYRSGGDFQIKNDNGVGTPETSIVLAEDGAVTLYHDASSKLATTSSGVNIVGTATMDGLTVDGVARAGSGGVVLTGQYSSSYPNPSANGYFQLKTNNQDANRGGITIARSSDTSGTMLDALRINYLGDISFYEDTGSSAALFWDASAERLGLGTTLPNANLHVLSSGNGEIEIERASGALINLQAQSARGVIGTDTNHELQLKTNGSGRMTISTAGNVGIGTIPADKLHVEGNLYFGTSTRTIYTGGSANLHLQTNTGEILFLTNNGSSEVMRIDDNNRVGIGTSSPQDKLSIEGGDVSINNGSAFQVGGSISGNTIVGRLKNESGVLTLKGDSTRDVQFGSETNGTAMFIEGSNGNIGIGTVLPSQALHVESSSSGTSKIVGAFINPNSGVVGTGAQLWLSGSNATTRGTYIEGQVRGSGNKHDLIFATSGDASTPAERLRITSAGRLGLGTTNPLVRTHIATSVSSGSLVDSLLVSQNTASSTSGQGARILLSSLNASNRAAGIAAIAGSSSNHDLAFYTNGNFATPTEKMRILANNGNVGIATVSPTNGNLQIGDTNTAFNIAIAGPRAKFGYSGDNAIVQGGTAKGVAFCVNTSTLASGEAGRFDTSGNLLVGKSSSSLGTAGHEIFHNGVQWLTASNSRPLLLNRLSTDGTIAEFRKDGTTVGSIGTVGADVTIGTGDTGLRFRDEFDAIQPHNITTNGTVDGVISLGKIGATFKDLHLSGTAYINGTAPSILLTDSDTGADSRISASSGAGSLFIDADLNNEAAFSTMSFRIDGSEAGRFDASGNFLVGKTASGLSTDGAELAQGGTAGKVQITRTSNAPLLLNRRSTDGTILDFRKDGTTVGSISVTSSATTYNTSSDARLKDVTGEARGLEVITKLNPVAYNWKADGKADEGLIAQEVKELVPNAVTGSEDEHYQMDYSKLVTHLVKAVQELEQQTIELKKEIANLKGE